MSRFTSLAREQKPLLHRGQGVRLQDLAKQLQNLTRDQIISLQSTSFQIQVICVFLKTLADKALPGGYSAATKQLNQNLRPRAARAPESVCDFGPLPFDLPQTASALE